MPTQLPPSLGRSPALPRGSPVSPVPAGRAVLSAALGGAPPWGSQRLRGHPSFRQVLSVVAGMPSALSSGPSAWLSLVAVEPFPGVIGARVSPAASSAGPGLTNYSALLGLGPPTPDGRCLPLTSALPVCSHLGVERSWLPNYLHHRDIEELWVAAQAWGRLMQTHCHPFLAWFFCLLLLPPCGPGPLLSLPPCRQFCEAVEDSCWSHLDGGPLPVACATLRAQEDGLCVFIGPAAGNCPALPPVPGQGTRTAPAL